MIPKTYVSRPGLLLLICALSLGATVQGAHAQGSQARDTTMGQTNLPPNVNVIRGGAPLVQTSTLPANVRDVRQRIRNLGPGQRRVRVVTPIIVAPSSRPMMQVVGPDSVVRMVPAPGFTDEQFDPRLLQLAEDNILRRIDTRFDELYEALGRPNPRTGRTEISLGDSTGVADSLALADTTAAPPPVVEVESEPEEPAPPEETTPRVVEREILDTGLFRAVDINFEFDRSVLLPEAEPVLDAVGEVLTKYPTLQVEIGGHTDSIGPEAYNQQLSQARARSVLDY
ncbi:MAG TPA: OmpA family protein, partial [Chloroflexota bacterium]|nr:OmpA family protein [Chloroflexota bacterium]